MLVVISSCNDNKQGEKISTDITFVEIAPIIYNNCTNCHRPNAAGPFSLANYEEIKRKSKTIVKVTQSRYMPPWPADPTYSNFKDEKILSQQEIDQIKIWVDNGCPIGDSSKISTAPVYPDGSQIGVPDMVIKFPEIQLKGNKEDHFFLVKVPYEMPTDKYVRTIEFIPGNKKAVHHMNANLIEYEPGKKKSVFGGEKIIPTNLAVGAEDVQTAMDNKNDDGTYPALVPLVCNYLPGVSPAIYPEGIGGFKMSKQGVFFINDLHFGPLPRDTVDSNSVLNIFFDVAPPRRPTYEILLGSLGVAPVKPALIIPAGEIKTFTIDYQVQDDMSILTINPHMHLIGTKFLAYATTPKGDTIPLIRINKWDFRWQYFYTFKKMLHIPAGSNIHVEGTYNNTSKNVNNPFFPPQVIIDRGNRFDSMKTTNEMLQFIITYLPYQKGDEDVRLGE
ncbi:MAG: hypothetical protein ACHQFW_09225 [Chitinophagales bacterium]